MAKIAGRSAYLTFVGKDISGSSRSVEFPRSVDPLDVTTFASGGYKEYLDGLLDAPISVDAFWDAATAATDLDKVLHDALLGGTKLWELMPQGSAAGRILYKGNGVLTSYGITTPVDGAVAVSLTIQSSGTITRSITA